MGNREALLEGAKRCLREKGFALTTARDVAEAAGVSLAAIGYHYGTVRALMNVALIDATREWGDVLARDLAAAKVSAAGTDDPLRRFERIWERIIASFSAHRALWAAHLEATALADRSPELREFLARSQDEGRQSLAELFHGDTIKDRRTILAVGSLHQALLFSVMSQMLIDPALAPSAKDLALAIRTIATTFGGEPPPATRARARRP